MIFLVFLPSPTHWLDGHVFELILECHVPVTEGPGYILLLLSSYYYFKHEYLICINGLYGVISRSFRPLNPVWLETSVRDLIV